MSDISTSLEINGTIPSLLKTIDKVLKTEPKALTLMIASGNGFTKETLDPLLASLPIPVSGGVFHKIIFKENLLDKGSIIIAWYNDITITNYKNIDNTNSIKDLIATRTETSQQTNNIGEYLIFIDGGVSNLEENLDALYKKNGFRATFAGGGAGSALFESTPCIISNDGLLKNTMQTVATNHKSLTTVTHGFQKQSGPHLVTSADKTTIKSLNYESIIAFYKKHNTKYGDHQLKNTQFSSFFSEYPVGIEKLDGELLIRDPVRYDDDNVEYIGNIPEYSKVHILNGSKDSVRHEVDKELDSLKFKDEKNINTSFIFSCAHRDDADHNGSSKELKMLNTHLSNSKNIVGALTIGEIATSESRLLHLHSKTIVISRLAGEA